MWITSSQLVDNVISQSYIIGYSAETSQHRINGTSNIPEHLFDTCIVANVMLCIKAYYWPALVVQLHIFIILGNSLHFRTGKNNIIGLFENLFKIALDLKPRLWSIIKNLAKVQPQLALRVNNKAGVQVIILP